jgi:hypothetical protein
MKVGLMVWRLCPHCKCQATKNDLPDGGSFTVKRLSGGISHVTSHMPGCPRGFKKVEIPE